MPVTMMKGGVLMEMKKVSISAKRQIQFHRNFLPCWGLIRKQNVLCAAVEAMLVDAERIAVSESDYVSYNDVFDVEEEG